MIAENSFDNEKYLQKCKIFEIVWAFFPITNVLFGDRLFTCLFESIHFCAHLNRPHFLKKIKYLMLEFNNLKKLHFLQSFRYFIYKI